MPIIRTSDRLQFKRCRRAWDLGSKIRQDYEPLLVPKPLEFGSAIHSGLEAYYEPLTWGDTEVKEALALKVFTNTVSLQRDKYLKVTQREGIDDPEVERDFKAEYELGLGMLKHYFTWAPEHDAWFTPVKVEIEFEVPIPDPQLPGELLVLQDDLGSLAQVVYQGRVDLLVVDKDGRYWIVDHKTAAQFGNTEWLDMDEQGGSYCWALNRMLNLPIAGVIYNRLLKDVPKRPEPLVRGGFSKNKQQRTTYDVYLSCLKENNEPFAPYLDFLDFLQEKGNPFFQRQEVHRSRTEQENLGHQIGVEAIDMLSDPAIYPNAGMFTCMGCSYKAPCLAMNDGSDYKYILSQLYRKRDSNNDVIA